MRTQLPQYFRLLVELTSAEWLPVASQLKWTKEDEDWCAVDIFLVDLVLIKLSIRLIFEVTDVYGVLKQLSLLIKKWTLISISRQVWSRVWCFMNLLMIQNLQFSMIPGKWSKIQLLPCMSCASPAYLIRSGLTWELGAIFSYSYFFYMFLGVAVLNFWSIQNFGLYSYSLGLKWGKNLKVKFWNVWNFDSC